MITRGIVFLIVVIVILVVIAAVVNKKSATGASKPPYLRKINLPTGTTLDASIKRLGLLYDRSERDMAVDDEGVPFYRPVRRLTLDPSILRYVTNPRASTTLQAIGTRLKSLYLRTDLARDSIGWSVKVLHLENPLLARMNRNMGSLTVHDFIDRVIRGHELNPVIVDMTNIIPVDYILDYEITSDKATDIRIAVGFCVLLQYLVSILYYERDTYTLFYEKMMDLKHDSIYLPYLGAFEAAKMYTIDVFGEGNLFPAEMKDGPNNDDVPLRMNILEAILQDRVVKDNDDNADAGGVLFRNGLDQKTNPLTGQKPSTVSRYGNSEHFFPFGEDWINIYIGWNMDFVMGEGNLTMISKLSFPMLTENYHRDDRAKDWLGIRALSLWVMIQHEVLWRARSRSSQVMLHNWANPSVYLPCGAVVLEHAKNYERRIKDVMKLGRWWPRAKFNVFHTTLKGIERTFTAAFRVINMLPGVIDPAKFARYQRLILLTQRSIVAAIRLAV